MNSKQHNPQAKALIGTEEGLQWRIMLTSHSVEDKSVPVDERCSIVVGDNKVNNDDTDDPM